MQDYDSSTQQQEKVERVRGIQSGELFVRLNGAKLFEPGGTLHGAHPFLKKLLHIQDDDTSAVSWLVQPSETKLAFTRKLRRQIRQRKCTAKRRWDDVRKAVEVYNVGSLDAMATHLTSITNPASNALDRYMQQFQRLEQAYKQHVTSDILHLYALLEAESRYVTSWSTREDAKCRDQCALTKLLHQFNSFSLQLESETSGQVRMWRLPSSDAQRIRCVKAATENIKKRFFSSPTQSLEVLDVYKIENKVLLNSFQSYASSLSKTTSEIKIKGLFCTVPPESVERCVVYGMHTTTDQDNIEPCFVDPQGAPVKVFNRSAYVLNTNMPSLIVKISPERVCASFSLLQYREDAPGTNRIFRARSKVNNGIPLQFPRRFSRYSTLEEMRASMTTFEPHVEDQALPVQYLGLCRVVMGKISRVKDNCASFPEDQSVGALHFINEEEYLVRHPDAVVPEFIVQFRVKAQSIPLPVVFTDDSIIPVSLTLSTSSVASGAFQDFIYSAVFDSSSTISAFPLSLPPSDRQRSFFTPNGPSVSSSPMSHGSQQDENISSKKADELRISPETVLENCTRQRKQIQEDLQRLERLFWSRARELWEEEGIRCGVKPKRGYQSPNSHEEAQTKIQQLRGELDLLTQMQDNLTRPKIRSKRPATSTRRR